MNGRLVRAQETPAEAAEKFAREIAAAQGQYSIKIGDTEWLLVQPFDILWETPNGEQIEVTIDQ